MGKNLLSDLQKKEKRKGEIMERKDERERRGRKLELFNYFKTI